MGEGMRFSDSWQQVCPHRVGVVGPLLGHHSIPEPAPHACTLTHTHTAHLHGGSGHLAGPTGLVRCFGFSGYTLQFPDLRRSLLSVVSRSLLSFFSATREAHAPWILLLLPEHGFSEALKLLPVLPGLPCLPDSLVGTHPSPGHTLCHPGFWDQPFFPCPGQ